MTSAILYTALVEQDLDELEEVLLNAPVYSHIGGMPSRDDFKLGLQRAMRGPPVNRSDEQWLNYVARLSSTNQILGRLEATVHHGIAEVAFLYGPQHRGNGYATFGLHWLHSRLRLCEGVKSLWATTVPANVQSHALLRRCGYVPVSGEAHLPILYSYDRGDNVYSRNSVA